MEVKKYSAMTESLLIYATDEEGNNNPNATTSQQMQDYMVQNGDTLKNLVDAFLWQPETEYAVGVVVRSPNMTVGTQAVCVTAGTSGTVEPVWEDETEQNTTDGTVVWVMKPVVLSNIGGGSSGSLVPPVEEDDEGKYLKSDGTWGLVAELSNENAGSNQKPIYVAQGKVVASNANIGSDNVPVYINNGTITACNAIIGTGIATTPVTNRKIEKNGNSVSLYWKDPEDSIIDGVTITEWQNTVIVKKQGSYPTSVTDGTVVVTSSVRDQYLSEPYVDTQTSPENWFYRAFPQSKGGLYSDSELNRFGFWHYAIYIDETDPDEETCVHNVEGYDNYFLDKCYMDFSADEFNWGGWSNAEFLPKPCMLQSNGTVAYYLNPDDYTKKITGEESDVTNTEFDGNAMLEWKPVFVKTEKADNKLYIYYCSEKYSGDYECWSAKKSDGSYAEHFYMPIYEGVNIGGKLRSMSTGTRPTANTTAETEATYANANGDGWDTTTWADEDLMRIMGILIFRRLNFQKACGYNCGSSSSALTHNTGTANTKGMFYGQESTSQYATKYFGMENWWGHRWRRCNGLMCINRRYYVKLTHSTIDGSTVTGYNRTASGYIDTGIDCPSASESYIKTISGDKRLITAPIVVSGASSTTYFCDAAWSNTGTTQLFCGGCVNSGVDAGLFAWAVDHAPSLSYWTYGASVSYKGF